MRRQAEARCPAFLYVVITAFTFHFWQRASTGADCLRNMMKTKVLEVIRQGQIGGGESHLADLMELIDKKEFELICLSFTRGEMISRLESMGIRCFVIETTKPFNLSIQRKIIRIIKSEQVKIIHAHGTRAVSNVLIPSLRLGLPLVYTVHGWSFHDDQRKFMFSVRKWSERFICHFASRVICVSEGNVETGRRVFGLRDAVVIKNGVNLNKYNLECPSALAKADLGFADGDFVVGFISRCTKQKAPLVFLESLRQAHHVSPTIKGLFVGEGDMDAEVDDYIARHRMEEYLYRSGFRTDIPEVLPLMEAYCLPSLWEGLSIGLLEAMATGRVIVATPTDGTREVLRDGENGVIVPFDSPDVISQTFLRLQADQKLCKHLGHKASAFIADKYNAQFTADAVADIYKMAFYKDKYGFGYD